MSLHHLPIRLRLNSAKRRQQAQKIARQIARMPQMVGFTGLTSTDREIRTKRRRRWTKEHDPRHVKRRQMVTGTIGGLSRMKVHGWDPAKAGDDRTVYPLHLGSGIMVGPRAHKALLDYFDSKEDEVLLMKECGVPMNMILVEDPAFSALDGEGRGLLIRDWRSILTPTPPVIIDPYSGRKWGGP